MPKVGAVGASETCVVSTCVADLLTKNNSSLVSNTQTATSIASTPGVSVDIDGVEPSNCSSQLELTPSGHQESSTVSQVSELETIRGTKENSVTSDEGVIDTSLQDQTGIPSDGMTFTSSRVDVT